MPKRKIKLPPLQLATDESFGRRLARLRKERGLTQVQMAEKVGIIQPLVADYERDKLRLNAEMICRFTKALHVTADELLGLKKAANEELFKTKGGLSLKLVRRIQKIDCLPAAQQKAILRSIDLLLSGIRAEAS